MSFNTLAWLGNLFNKLFVRWWSVRLKNTGTHISLEVHRVKRAAEAAKQTWHIHYVSMPNLVLEHLQKTKIGASSTKRDYLDEMPKWDLSTEAWCKPWADDIQPARQRLIEKRTPKTINDTEGK